MISFAWPWMFLLIPVPLILRLLLPVYRPREGAALRIPFFDDLQLLTQQNTENHWRAIFALLAIFCIWVLVVTAGARPQWLGEPLEFPISGRDIMLAVDISESMETPDFVAKGQRVTRLDVVKQTAADFIDRRKGDRIGLILFGTRAYLQTPLTFDLRTVKQMLLESEVKLAGEKTAIGDAMGIALKRFQEVGHKQKILILLTDGYNTSGVLDPRQGGRLAAAAGMKVYTLGIGAEEMPVAGFFGTRLVNPSRSLDERLLKDIATGTGGVFFRATDTQGLLEIYKQLDRLEPVGKDSEMLRPVTALYYWPLGIALVLSVIGVIGFAGSWSGFLPGKLST